MLQVFHPPLFDGWGLLHASTGLGVEDVPNTETVTIMGNSRLCYIALRPASRPR